MAMTFYWRTPKLPRRALSCGTMCDTIVQNWYLVVPNPQVRALTFKVRHSRVSCGERLVWLRCHRDGGLLRNSDRPTEILSWCKDSKRDHNNGSMLSHAPKPLYHWSGRRKRSFNGQRYQGTCWCTSSRNNDSTWNQSNSASIAHVPNPLSRWRGKSGCYPVNMTG